ncbi:3-deoxy-manno-octulosonate cytidylyltransferase [Candidatus Kaiserbacteria bacterium RIFCSPLOWO2_02_FULL_56_11]|nr:MAG: 3-deoxy-manno-octulosonate cytidylyltransferase [Candidatus Kaiserbacteria bacterium RIFCSPLOWO2_02_FULL_56_11]
MNVIIIPARMASTRLPGKPLADINGIPMVVRVFRQARAANIGPVIVAAAEAEIADAITKEGGESVLTDPALASGSDRVHAAIEAYDPIGKFDAVINLQGDLPNINPEALRAVETTLEEGGADIATLAAPIADPADYDNPNVVKPIVAWESGGQKGRALYFTRARAPGGEGELYHHIGIYAFTRAALRRFVALPPSPLEKRERLEQLRALEEGMRIDVARVGEVPLSVDTTSDLERARAVIR